jgi:hypothetical protein
MSKIPTFEVRKFTNTPMASGATLGDQHRLRLDCLLESSAAATDPDSYGQMVAISFKDMEAVTSSYLKALLFPMFPSLSQKPGAPAYSPMRASNVYPVLSNVSSEIKDEVQELLQNHTINLLELKNAGHGDIPSAYLYGSLEGVLAETLRLLVTVGEATAPELHRRGKGPGAVTAWNNRLNDLFARRLARRRRDGRQWMFRAVAEPTNV